MPEVGDKESYEFGQFRLNVAEHLLEHFSGERVQLSEKAFETLCVLVRNGGRLIEKNELLNQVWAESFVEENNLDKCIYAIRKALGEKPGEQKYVETVRKHGYRFVAKVRRIETKNEGIEPTQETNGKQPKTKQILTTESPRLAKQNSTQNSAAAVTALADWRREADEKKSEELIESEKLTEQTAKSELAPTIPVSSDSKRNPNRRASRLLLAAFALTIFFIGAIALGYNFYRSRNVAPGADSKKSIAVLPLKPINTANRDVLYESGIADSLIIRLSSMKGIFVRPLSATRKYADIEQDPIVAGREQRVDYVLASNYQLANGKIRVTAQLFNVADGEVEETYKIEKEAGDVFAIQDAIAGEMGNRLLARFAIASSNNPAARRGTTNEEAYRLYLHGKNLTGRQNSADGRKAVEHFEQAIRLDPNFANAYSGLARAYVLSGAGGGLPRAEREKANEALKKALELDSNLAEGYAVRGNLKIIHEWDLAGAEKDLLRAIELEPNNDFTHLFYAVFLTYRGRFDEALAETDTALMINPDSLGYQVERGRFLYYARRYDEAIVQFKRVLEVDEDFGVAWGFLWLAYEMKGDYAGAYEAFMKRQKISHPDRVEVYQKAYETAGWQAVRRKYLEFDKLDEQKPESNLFAIARNCALLGEKEQAFEYLNKAFEKRQRQMVILNVEPALDSLRDDPRFDELVRRVGLK